MQYILLIIALACFLFSLLSYLLFGRERKTFAGIQTEPPHGLNPLEMALIYNKKALPSDSVALLYYLASKDFLSIAKSADKKIILTKLKQYDGDNAVEKYIFDSIFYKDKMTTDEIRASYSCCSSFIVAAQAINSNSNRSKYFSAISLKLKLLSRAVNMLGLLLINILFIQSFSVFIFILAFTLFQGVALLIAGSGNEVEIGFWNESRVKKGLNRIKNNLAVSAVLITFISFIAIISMFSINNSLSIIDKIIFSISYVVCLSILVISQLVASAVDRRTVTGSNLYQEIINFKHFLNTTDRLMVEKLYKESPRIFRKIISYGFILGISKVWTNDFDVLVFGNIFSTVYGNDYSDIDTDNALEVAAMQEDLKKHRVSLADSITQFNNLIINQNLKLFGKIYKETLKVSKLNFGQQTQKTDPVK